MKALRYTCVKVLYLQLTIALLLLLPAVCMAVPNKTALESTTVDSSAVPSIPDEYKDWKWHRYETENFEVLAIKKDHGEAIAKRAEHLKTWANERWGFEDKSYWHKCMILCVPTQDVFRKWFRRTDVDPKIAKSKTLSGHDRTVYGIWLSGEGRYLTAVLPEKIGRINLLNFEIINTDGSKPGVGEKQVKLGKWAHVGMSALNNDLTTIRQMLGSEYKPYSVKALFAEEVPVIGPETALSYRARAAALCLMLRKLRGSERYMSFLIGSSIVGPQASLDVVYGFERYEQFQVRYDRYVRNLAFDIQHNKTPDMGLTWFLPKKSGK